MFAVHLAVVFAIHLLIFITRELITVNCWVERLEMLVIASGLHRLIIASGLHWLILIVFIAFVARWCGVIVMVVILELDHWVGVVDCSLR